MAEDDELTTDVMSVSSPPGVKEVAEPTILKLAYKPTDLPCYSEFKHFIPDCHTEESVSRALEVYGDLLQEQTTNRARNIFTGVLDVERGVVICKKRKAKGAGFHRMGQQSKEGFTFQAEEALIQAEFGVLEVYPSDTGMVPYCLQSLYEILLPFVSLPFYRTFSYLTRLGYCVRRRLSVQHDPKLSPQNPSKEDSRHSVDSSSNVKLPCDRSAEDRLQIPGVLEVRKPQSDIVDFSIVTVRGPDFPELGDVLEMCRAVGSTAFKMASVEHGNVFFYSTAIVDFPDAHELR